ncbi:MAG TPA: aldehyde dehydrogenase family protein [Ktedonobacteraceae bacterium]|nr:aldehyde dehydrogenase family protein [Ktedonobacteraceae bacterium]
MAYQMWINGAHTTGSSGKMIEVRNPATEEIIDTAPAGDAADVDQAVTAAQAAFPAWKKVPAGEKAELLHEVARQLTERAAEFARLLTLEGGKPFVENKDEMGWSAACFRYYAEIGRSSRGRVIPSIEESQLAMVLKEPYGVVAAIVPWNYPILLMAWKVAPALAAGNTVVLKPSEMTPLSTLLFAEIFAHFPPGVINIVSGYGKECGEPLVVDPRVRVIAFTGSLATGQRIAQLVAPQMKKLHLELGGKDAFIVAEDANLDVAVPGVAWAALLNAGQVCTSTERVYVHEAIAPTFVERIADYARKLRLGSGLEPDTDMGPLIGNRYREKVETQVEAAKAQGASVIAGGQRPKHLQRGYFYEPTVLTNVNHTMAIMREETFGPIIPIMTYRSFDEAIALANDSQYGLGANLYTHDPAKAKRFFEEVEAGTLWINDPLTDNDAGPFGGFKMSGIGRELGEEGLDEFRETKHVHWDFEGGAKPWWYPYGKP